jgi:hypothetical protein
MTLDTTGEYLVTILHDKTSNLSGDIDERLMMLSKTRDNMC